MNAMAVCETNYETCGANGQSESSDSVSDSSGSESLDNAEIPHQSSVMAIVRERLRTAHGLEHTESDHFIWSTESEVYEEELPLAKRRSCKLPLRFVISSLIIIAVLASSCTMYAYLMLQWSRAHGETINLFRDSFQEQGRRLELQILDSSRLAYDKLLLNIEWSVWWYIIQPPSQAAQSMFTFLKTVHLNPGWNEWTDLLAEAARTQLRDQWEENTGEPGEHALQQVIRDRLQGFAYSLVITYCTGLFAGASITLDGNKSYTFKTRPPMLPGLPGANLSLSVFSQEGSESHLERTLEFQPTSRPYYLVQKQLFEKGASQQQSSSDAWTGVFNYTIPWKPMTRECGYAKSLPIPFCNGLSEGVGSACDGFCGAIASHVSLETMKEALQVQWQRIHDYLASPLYNYELLASKSSVFTLIQKSNAAPKQEGFLLAASNDPEQGCNFRYANDSPLHIVSSAARALHRRMGGSWNAELLHSRFMMNFSMAEIELGRSVPCLSLTKDCFDAATLQIKLDDDLHWLVVLVLPADAFTLTAASQQSAWEGEIEERATQVSHDVTTINRISVVLLTVSALFGLTAGWCISAFAGYPLNKLQAYMQKLSRLDLDGIPGLRSRSLTKLSSLREVSELQLGFVNLAQSVETFSRFVPETVVRRILHGDKKATRIHVRKRTVTIMFSDIRGFTTISEMLSQTDLLTLLYMYLSEMTQIVEKHGGVVSEILGDGLLVLWNTPDDLPDHAVAACAAAVAQQKALTKLNESFAELGLPSISIRIGLHTGDVLAGNIGSCKKMKYGCMGDPVNLASRLEGLAKYYGVGTLCSDATRAKLPPHFLCRKLDLVKVKGKEEAVWVYELIHETPTPWLQQKVQLYEAGLRAYHDRGFVPAAQKLATLLAQEPQDKAAAQLLDRAHEAQRLIPFPAEWSPVMEMTEK